MKLRTKAKYTDAVTPLELANGALSQRAAEEAIVLLENKGILPLKPGKIALYGAGAGKTIKGGTGSGEVMERRPVSIWEGLESRGFEVVTRSWLRDYNDLWNREQEAFLQTMQKKLTSFSTKVLAELMAAECPYPYGQAIRGEDLSTETDTCLYVLSRQSGEGRDRRREDFVLSDTERAHLQACSEGYRHIVLVLNTGASFDLSFVRDFPAIEAVVYACQLGQAGGYALADVLTGAVSPSGKLAATWVKSYEDVPFGEAYGAMGDLQHAAYREGIYVGYRYYDSFHVEPAYPFGYGLSYTKFHMEPGAVQAHGSSITAQVSVKNTGDWAGRETVQLYVSPPVGKLDREYQSLAAFSKTELLQPGEAQELELAFDMSQLAAYEEETASMVLEAGDYLLRLGNSSRNTAVQAVIRLEEKVVVSQHKNLCASKEKVQSLCRRQGCAPVQAPTLLLHGADFIPEITDYTPKPLKETGRASAFLDTLSVKEQLQFCAGTGLLGGKTFFTLPGAVGNTTSAFWKRGIPNAAFCDGPAGLRLQRRSTVNEQGAVKPVDGAISLYAYLPKCLQKCLFGNPNKETVLYQYVTSFPVAAAMAQTWNLPLLEEVGRGIGREMEEYGVVFWLAPALNLVRNPLCGRNYEYYSEDPLLSGKLAAAVTRGVQSCPGRYVTIKHFAANNQEENRYYVSSDMDERTLRELYLRGFEIAVKEASPKGLMTAYNRINSIYCPVNRELIQQILRQEWGFDGVVMTDWLSTGEDRAPHPDCLAAGTDLIMPGGKGVCRDLYKAYRAGRLSKADIRRSAYNVLKLILRPEEQQEV